MMNVGRKNTSKLTLASVLKRRKTTLREFTAQLGLSTYEAVCDYSVRMGIVPPSETEYADAVKTNKQDQTPVLKETVVQESIADDAPETVKLSQRTSGRGRVYKQELDDAN